MREVVVQKRIPLTSAIIVLFLIIGIVIFAYFQFFSNGFDLSLRAKNSLGNIIFGLGIILYFLFKESFNREEYVSKLVFSKDLISILYKKGEKISKKKTFDVSEISSFFVRTKANITYCGRYKSLDTKHFVKIKLKNGEEINFEAKPSFFSFSPAYQFLLEMISYSRFIPNFSYSLQTDNKEIKREIKYFEKYGKRLPFLKKKGAIALIVLYILIAISFVSLGFSFFFMLKPKREMPKSQKAYIEIFRQIDDYRNDGNFEMAYKKVEEAKKIAPNDYNVYLYESYIEERQKNYEKEIELAKKALFLIENGEKSLFDEAFKTNGFVEKHIFKSQNEKYARTYDRLAKANFELKNYQEAENYYTKELENSNYKYYDIHFYRGISRFYLGKYQEAKEDFLLHKEIVEKYLEEMQDMLYPQYDKDDLDLINRWLEATEGYLK